MRSDAKDAAHLKELTIEMFRSRDGALHIANIAMEKRLDAMNQFRDALKDQAGQFITRDEHQLLTAMIEALAMRVTGLETKFWLGGTGIVIVITLLQVALNYWHAHIG